MVTLLLPQTRLFAGYWGVFCAAERRWGDVGISAGVAALFLRPSYMDALTAALLRVALPSNIYCCLCFCVCGKNSSDNRCFASLFYMCNIVKAGMSMGCAPWTGRYFTLPVSAAPPGCRWRGFATHSLFSFKRRYRLPGAGSPDFSRGYA